MTDTLSSMIEEFKRCTNNLALPGQKKRLQNIHVDMVIAIEEQCLKDGYSVHEKARVAHSLRGLLRHSEEFFVCHVASNDEMSTRMAHQTWHSWRSLVEHFANNTAPTTAFNKTTPSPVAAPTHKQSYKFNNNAGTHSK
ncbi:hypothetical protein COOONC_12811 [Cooperia oncophora]